jgi:hypothetical protein
MDNNIYNERGIPTEEADPKFWQTLGGAEFKRVMSLLIFNEIRRYNPETLNDQQCRTQLAKIKAYQDAIDFSITRCEAVEDEDLSGGEL